MSFNNEDEIKIEYEESLDNNPLTEDTPCTRPGILIPSISPIVEITEATERYKPDEVIIENEETSESDLHPQEEPTSNSGGIFIPNISPLVKITEAADFKDVGRKVPVQEENEVPKGSILDSALDENVEGTVSWYKRIDGFGKLICNFCDRTYSVLTSLRYHVNIKHPEQVASLKYKILQKRRKSQPTCHLCKKRFKLLTALKIHMKEHNIENIANSCRHCNAALSNTQELIDHLVRNHNVLQKKLHVCNTCGYRTYKVSHLKQHSDTHSNEKRYKCTICDYATNHKSNLKNHERIHTREKSYVCQFEGCSVGFTDLTGLSCHIQKHYPERNMLHCDKCSYKTVYKQSLNVHSKSHKRL